MAMLVYRRVQYQIGKSGLHHGGARGGPLCHVIMPPELTPPRLRDWDVAFFETNSNMALEKNGRGPQ